MSGVKVKKFIEEGFARNAEQLQIMRTLQAQGVDPLDMAALDQPILEVTDYWYVTPNRFPYDNTEEHLLVVCKDPVYDASKLTDEQFSDLGRIFTKYSVKLGGGALVMRFGSPALSGASLARVHCHLIKPVSGKKVRAPIGKEYK